MNHDLEEAPPDSVGETAAIHAPKPNHPAAERSLPGRDGAAWTRCHPELDTGRNSVRPCTIPRSRLAKRRCSSDLPKYKGKLWYSTSSTAARGWGSGRHTVARQMTLRAWNAGLQTWSPDRHARCSAPRTTRRSSAQVARTAWNAGLSRHARCSAPRTARVPARRSHPRLGTPASRCRTDRWPVLSFGSPRSLPRAGSGGSRGSCHASAGCRCRATRGSPPEPRRSAGSCVRCST